MPIPTPEEIQYLLGIHPSQAMANQALVGGGEGDEPASTAVAPASQPAPTAKSDAEPVVIPPHRNLISRPVRGLDLPPVNTPGPVPGTVTTGAEGPNGTIALQPDSGQPVGYVPPAPKPTVAAPAQPVDMPSLSGLLTTPIRPISADQAQENKDRAERDRLTATGSGVSQFQKRHKFWGPVVRALDIAGSVIAPGPASLIPGTELHHKELVGEANQNIKRDIDTETAHAHIQTGEEAQQARIQANRIREEGMQDKINQANQKFVAGSEHEDPNSPTGYTAQTVGGEWKPFTPPSSYKQTKGESFEDIQARRGKEADNLGLTGEKRTFYLANGKLHEPGTPAAGAQEYDEWKTAFHRDHGRDPNAEEIAAFKHGGAAAHPKDMRTAHSGIEKDKQVQLTSEANRFRKEWEKAYKDADGKPDQKDLDGLNAEHQARKDGIQSNYEQRIQELSGEPGAAAPAAPAAQPAPAGKTAIEQPIAPVRTAKPSPATQAKAPGTDIGPAPDNSPEGRTGKLPDGTKVIVKGGRLVAQ